MFLALSAHRLSLSHTTLKKPVEEFTESTNPVGVQSCGSDSVIGHFNRQIIDLRPVELRERLQLTKWPATFLFKLCLHLGKGGFLKEDKVKITLKSLSTTDLFWGEIIVAEYLYLLI